MCCKMIHVFIFQNKYFCNVKYKTIFTCPKLTNDLEVFQRVKHFVSRKIVYNYYTY